MLASPAPPLFTTQCVRRTIASVVTITYSCEAQLYDNRRNVGLGVWSRCRALWRKTIHRRIRLRALCRCTPAEVASGSSVKHHSLRSRSVGLFGETPLTTGTGGGAGAGARRESVSAENPIIASLDTLALS